MKLTSNDFTNGEKLDKKFTGQAESFSPHLKWEDPPKETKSFALTLIDPNTEVENWSLWNVYDVPKDVREIPQNGPVPGKIVENDYRELGYTGPCPEEGMHDYNFTIYALDIEHLKDVERKNFRKMIHLHTIEKATIVGRYKSEIDFRQFRDTSCHMR
ncbi:MAG: YbhB/YbcL family Raf kinase inhibitor-like protein [Promethearchaeia archaeon]